MKHGPRQDTVARGRAAEDAAVAWLERHGYEIVERNVRTKPGEIDLVALDRDTLCFIEIKARWNRGYGSAVTAVPAPKQRRIAQAAGLYLAACEHSGPCRFDVLALDRRDHGWSFTLVRDAFEMASP